MRVLEAITRLLIQWILRRREAAWERMLERDRRRRFRADRKVVKDWIRSANRYHGGS